MADEVDMEDASSASLSNGHCNEIDTSENRSVEQESERELTQTDHLNKRLLGAFLERLNRNEVSMISGTGALVTVTDNDVQENETSDGENEWDSEIPEADAENGISEDADNK